MVAASDVVKREVSWITIGFFHHDRVPSAVKGTGLAKCCIDHWVSDTLTSSEIAGAWDKDMQRSSRQTNFNGSKVLSKRVATLRAVLGDCAEGLVPKERRMNHEKMCPVRPPLFSCDLGHSLFQLLTGEVDCKDRRTPGCEL